MKYLTLVLLSILISCANGNADEPDSEINITLEWPERYEYTYLEIDGLNCVIVLNVGLSCDWSNKEESYNESAISLKATELNRRM